MSESVLKSFVVKLGFRTDSQQFKNFQENMRVTAKNAAEMGRGFAKVIEATALSTTGIGLALKAVSAPMAAMYFAAQRTRSSAKDLDVYEYAMKQIGVSAEEAQASIESLAAARRTQPGTDSLLEQLLGGKPGANNVKVMLDLLDKLRSKSHPIAALYAGDFGISEQLLQSVTDNYQEFSASAKERQEMLKKSGIDDDAMALESVKYMRNFNRMSAALEDFGKKLSTTLMPMAAPVLKFLSDIGVELGKLDKSTGGWSTKIIALILSLKTFASALRLLGRMTGISTLLGGLGKAVGLGGATAGAAEATGAVGLAEGGAAAGGAGLLATVGIPVLVAAAVVAALTYMMLHPEQVRKVAGEVWDAGKKAAAAIGNAAKTEAGALPGQLHAAGAAVGTFAQNLKSAGAGGTLAALGSVPGALGGLARMVAGFEGHVANFGSYRDIAGKLTTGFGHLIRPGEDLNGLDQKGAVGLLVKDLTGAVASVHQLVKVKLSQNQENALADFVYNVGAKKFADSTLLRKLNSGDFAGAADQFQYWNHALVNGHMAAVRGLSDRRAAEAQLFRTPDKGVQIKQTTNIHVEGGDAKSTGREVAQQQSRVNGDMVRNFARATQ